MRAGQPAPETGSEVHRGRRSGAGNRPLALLAVGVISSLFYLSFALVTKGVPATLPLSSLRTEIIPRFLIHFACLFALYLASVWWTLRDPTDDHSTMLAVLISAIAFRALLLWTPPVLSDDIYRYVWDGRVQAAGLNPYLHPPQSPDLAHLRDVTIFPRINRPWAPTIYPPGAQQLFRAIHAARPDSLLFLKGTIVAFDLLTILLLMELLRLLGLPAGRAILYAWNPLVVFELASSGHVDGLMLPFLLLCLIFWVRRRDGVAGASLGVAAAIKLYPALLMPALVLRRGSRLLLGAGAVVVLLYLPYVWTAGPRVLGFLPQYLSDPGERFNSGPGYLIADSLGSLSPYLAQVPFGLFAIVLLAVGLRGTHRGDKSLHAVVAEALLLFGTFVTFAKTVHPWYLLWVLPLLAIRPSACWLYLSGAVALSYVAYTDESLRMPFWAEVLEYLPFYLLIPFALPGEMLRRDAASISESQHLRR